MLKWTKSSLWSRYMKYNNDINFVYKFFFSFFFLKLYQLFCISAHSPKYIFEFWHFYVTFNVFLSSFFLSFFLSFFHYFKLRLFSLQN